MACESKQARPIASEAFPAGNCPNGIGVLVKWSIAHKIRVQELHVLSLPLSLWLRLCLFLSVRLFRSHLFIYRSDIQNGLVQRKQTNLLVILSSGHWTNECLNDLRLFTTIS